VVLRYFFGAHPEASKLSPQEWGMDTRTTMRELDEVIARVQSAAEREPPYWMSWRSAVSVAENWCNSERCVPMSIG
jgi:hypothetical protein